MSGHLAPWIAAGLVALSWPIAAQSQVADARVRASATITAGIAITTHQDFVLGSVLLRMPTPARSLALRESGLERIHDEVRSTDAAAPLSAAFVVTGDAGRSMSIAVPRTIDLVRVGGSQTIRIVTRTDFGGVPEMQTLLLAPRGEDGILAFNVGGRILLGRDAIAGDYRGTLAATAQYN